MKKQEMRYRGKDLLIFRVSMSQTATNTPQHRRNIHDWLTDRFAAGIDNGVTVHCTQPVTDQ